MGHKLHLKFLACFIVFSITVLQFGIGVSAQVHTVTPLMIITHEDFVSECERLSKWKNSTGMASTVVTWQDLADEYPGNDLPERIKRGIADWCLYRGVKYVMLVGDADMFPVRYISMDWNGHTPAPDLLNASDFVYSVSDLYYADLFNSAEAFDDWDYDKNGMYGELWGAWRMTGLGPINYDRLDMFPDVSVGRVPASTVEEVRNYVDKVISYETHATKESHWLMNALLVADGVNELGQYDLSNGVEAELTPFGFNVLGMYDVDLSNPPRPYRDRPDPTMITNELNKGKGYVNFAGHGSPAGLPSFGPSTDDYSVWFSRNTGHKFNDSVKAKFSFCYGLYGLPAAGDFDADGKSDIIFFEWNGTVRYSYAQTTSSGSVYFPTEELQADLSPYFAAEPGYPKLGDFNGDHRMDLVQLNRTNGEIYITLSLGGATGGPTFYTPAIWGSAFCTGMHSWVVGDFNGDSYDDLLYRTGSVFYMASSTGSGFTDKIIMLNAMLPDSYMVPGDYNADGIDDLALIDFTSGNVNYLKSTGQSFLIDSSLFYPALCPMDIVYGAQVFSADVFGDGSDDLVLFLKDSRIGGTRTEGEDVLCERSDVWVLNSTGLEWSSLTVYQDSFCIDRQIPCVGNFNGAGHDDILLFNRYDGGDPFTSLRNEDLYPILFASSCSTAEFAIVPPWVDYLATTGVNQTGCNKGTRFPLTTFHGVQIRLAPAPDPFQPFDTGCIAERFLVQYDDRGAVAYFGGVEVTQGFVNELNQYFIDDYVSGENILGNMWNYALKTYLTDRSLGRGEQAKYAGSWVDVVEYQHPSKISLLGDPSLRVFETPDPTIDTSELPRVIVIIGGAILVSVIAAVVIRRIRSHT